MDSDSEVFKALQAAQSSVKLESDAKINTLLNKLPPIDMARRDDGGETHLQQGANNNPLPILDDITVYDTDGSTILHTGNGTGFWPIAIDDGEPPTMTNVAWYKIAWCDNTDPMNPVSGTRYALLSPFVAD